MHDDNNLKIASWIAARLNGTIQQEEEKMLEEWIHENDEHQLFYERLVERDYLTGRLQEYENYSLEALKERVMFSVSKQRKRIRLIRRIKQIAAILLIPLIAGSVFLFMVEKKEISPLATDIIPGKECAVLEMADGRKVELGLGKNLGQLQLEGTVVTNDSNRLAYKQNHSGNPSTLEYNTIIIPRGGEYQLILSDGSRVWLNSDTRLRYPVSFIGEKREVYLEGEAYFEVSHSDKPFEVHGGGQCVRVLGTSFNVMAYGDESKVQTTLVSGSVRVVLDQSDKTVLLTPGHQAELDKNSGKITMREVNVENYIGWKDKLFMFDEEDMVTIMNKLARWYDVDIIIETPELKEKVFYGVIRKYENISTILDMLKKTQNIDYLIEGKKIVIKEVR